MAKRGKGLPKPLDELEHENLVRKCPDCGSTDIEHDTGEYYCGKCGMVLE